MRRRASVSPAAEIPTLTGKADADVVGAIELIAQRSQHAAAELSGILDKISELQNVAAPLTGAEIKAKLQVNGGNALDVTGLLGVLAQPQKPGVPLVKQLPTPVSTNNGELVNFNGVLYYLNAPTDPGQWLPISAVGTTLLDTHANRLLNYPPANYAIGTTFWETDRKSLYLATDAVTRVWTFILGQPMSGSTGSRPADLGVNDAGFPYRNTTTGTLQSWTGTTFIDVSGVMSGTHAARPATAGVGVLYVETDRGNAVYRSTGSNWVLIAQAYPLDVTLSPDTKPAGLGVNDTGFLITATDFFRQYVWVGTGWVDVPGQESRDTIQFFNIAPIVKGWQLCDGSTVTESQADGSTASVPVPDLSTVATWIAGGNSVTTGSFAAVGANYPYASLLPYYRL